MQVRALPSILESPDFVHQDKSWAMLAVAESVHRDGPW